MLTSKPLWLAKLVLASKWASPPVLDLTRSCFATQSCPILLRDSCECSARSLRSSSATVASTLPLSSSRPRAAGRGRPLSVDVPLDADARLEPEPPTPTMARVSSPSLLACGFPPARPSKMSPPPGRLLIKASKTSQLPLTPPPAPPPPGGVQLERRPPTPMLGSSPRRERELGSLLAWLRIGSFDVTAKLESLLKSCKLSSWAVGETSPDGNPAEPSELSPKAMSSKFGWNGSVSAVCGPLMPLVPGAECMGSDKDISRFDSVKEKFKLSSCPACMGRSDCSVNEKFKLHSGASSC
mmetsp:Transcript_19051/g.52455  ORF Transcript_19051/g.52455 Transcript_19051/m.52455 type:complete len:297 (-) Transcript_19051:241-1131(-)